MQKFLPPGPVVVMVGKSMAAGEVTGHELDTTGILGERHLIDLIIS